MAGSRIGAKARVQLQNRWVEAVRELVRQIQSWAKDKGWPAQQAEETITEDPLGTYSVPALVVEFPAGRLQVRPIGCNIIGAEGRVDLEAYPTLNRIKLLRHDDGWVMVTDSNVPLRLPWNADTFAQLAQDLLA